jgi:hypothetical protein
LFGGATRNVYPERLADGRELGRLAATTERRSWPLNFSRRSRVAALDWTPAAGIWSGLATPDALRPFEAR